MKSSSRFKVPQILSYVITMVVNYDCMVYNMAIFYIGGFKLESYEAI